MRGQGGADQGGQTGGWLRSIKGIPHRTLAEGVPLLHAVNAQWPIRVGTTAIADLGIDGLKDGQSPGPKGNRFIRERHISLSVWCVELAVSGGRFTAYIGIHFQLPKTQ